MAVQLQGIVMTSVKVYFILFWCVFVSRRSKATVGDQGESLKHAIYVNLMLYKIVWILVMVAFLRSGQLQ
jgi:heme/copper-type cytochrome/quinol oxidase subunit 2